MGASRLTNNTAELQAIVEALLILLPQVDAEIPIIGLMEPLVIRSDSRCAVGAIRNGTRVTSSFLLRDFMLRLWKRAREAYDVRIV